MSINRVAISGNLTRDPELRQTSGGNFVLSLGVAVNDRRRNNQTGEWEDYTNFVDCTMFGNRAQALSQFLRKGMKVAIEGRLHYDSWEDRQTGQKRSKLVVYVNELDFMSSRNDNQGGFNGGAGFGRNGGQNGSGNFNRGGNVGYPTQQQAPAPQMPQAQPAVDSSVYDEDIPF